jgi:membrane peptidoglycan carboxypeptidase
VAITRVVDAEGNVLLDYKVPQGEQVIDPRAAYMTTNILADPAAKLFTYGPNTPLVLRRGDDPRGPIWPTASKTGTTDNYRDTWTNGYTPDLAIVVWVGNADGRPMKQTLSTMTAARIWPASMKLSFEYFNLQPQEFVRPDGLVERQVCGDTRMRKGAPTCWNDLFFAENAPRGTVNAGAMPAAPTPAATPDAAVDAPTVVVPAGPTPQPKPQSQPKPQATQPPAAPTPQPKPQSQSKPQATQRPAAPAPTVAPQPKPTSPPAPKPQAKPTQGRP